MEIRQKPESDTKYSLREYIRLRFDGLQADLRAAARGIERMSLRPISGREFDQLKIQVAGLVEANYEFQQRVEALEAHNRLSVWVIRQAVTAIIVIVVVYVMGFWR